MCLANVIVPFLRDSSTALVACWMSTEDLEALENIPGLRISPADQSADHSCVEPITELMHPQ